MHIGQRVFVYRNVTKRCYSIRAISGPQKGKVISHANFVQLENCEFKVSEAGRQRVIRERRKNVHAGVVGDLVFGYNYNHETGMAVLHSELSTSPRKHQSLLVPIFYNPYDSGRFRTKDGTSINTAGLCTLHLKGIVGTQLS